MQRSSGDARCLSFLFWKSRDTGSNEPDLLLMQMERAEKKDEEQEFWSQTLQKSSSITSD